MSALRDLDLLLDPGLMAALEEVARREWLLESIQAQKRQDRMSRELADQPSVDGIGACERRVDAFAFHDWALKMGSHDCWSDRGFTKYFDRIAPECKVRSRGTKVQVGYCAQTEFYCPLEVRKEPIFAKTYGPAPEPTP